MISRFLFVLFFCLCLMPFTGALAAEEKISATETAGEAGKLPDRIVRPMRAVDPITLQAEGVSIKLWGIRPARTSDMPLELKALDLMDSLIQEEQVNCKIVGGIMAELIGRCATQNNQDLALELLNNGYVVVDRTQTYNSVFASAYERAQELAREGAKGVWSFMSEEHRNSAIPRWMQPHIDFLLPIALIFGPLFGLSALAIVLWYWMRRLSEMQFEELETSRRKEAVLQSRERQVLMSMLEGELMENKNRIEAFLVIYGDVLMSLKDTSQVPKYQQGGDIVQKYPSFSRVVYEANAGKMSLLDIKLAGQISKLYSGLPKDQEYLNLDQNVPIETAIKLIEKVIRDAETLLVPINSVIQTIEEQLVAIKGGAA
jgi:endonuclease YncB( thermonuclease family)